MHRLLAPQFPLAHSQLTRQGVPVIEPPGTAQVLPKPQQLPAHSQLPRQGEPAGSEPLVTHTLGVDPQQLVLHCPFAVQGQLFGRFVIGQD